MYTNVYPVTEVYGSSPDSIDATIRKAVTTASKILRNVEWFAGTKN